MLISMFTAFRSYISWKWCTFRRHIGHIWVQLQASYYWFLSIAMFFTPTYICVMAYLVYISYNRIILISQATEYRIRSLTFVICLDTDQHHVQYAEMLVENGYKVARIEGELRISNRFGMCFEPIDKYTLLVFIEAPSCRVDIPLRPWKAWWLAHYWNYFPIIY